MCYARKYLYRVRKICRSIDMGMIFKYNDKLYS